MKTFIKFRVRYSETDQMGYVHHSNYANYFEIGRIDWLRKMGLNYAKMEKSGVLLPVQKINITYLKPVYYDDLLNLKTTIDPNISAKITFKNELFNTENTLVAKADVTLVFLDANTRKPIKPPAYFIEGIKNFKN